MSAHELNPFATELPVVVLLRCRQLATVAQIVEDSIFPLLGHLGREGRNGDLSHLVDDGQPSINLEGRAPASWRIDGRYNEAGAPHPLDIVGQIEPRAGGLSVAIPFAGAAGHKEDAA